MSADGIDHYIIRIVSTQPFFSPQNYNYHQEMWVNFSGSKQFFANGHLLTSPVSVFPFTISKFRHCAFGHKEGGTVEENFVDEERISGNGFLK